MPVEPIVAPFAAIRPRKDVASQVAARPYDVISFEEAAACAAGRPWSFLHVSRAEVDLPAGVDAHDPRVYAQARTAFDDMQRQGILIRDDKPGYYAYRMIIGDHVQTGVAAAGSIQAYKANRIRRHEHTRPDKELDRTCQIEAVGAHTGPVLATYPDDTGLAALLAVATDGEPIADATTDDGVRHQTWHIADAAAIAAIDGRFAAMPALYIADGHHRSAAAARVADLVGGNGRFLLISFPAGEMRILDYNRVVRDLHGPPPDSFLSALADHYQIAAEGGAVHPATQGEFGMYLARQWYRCRPRIAENGGNAVERLDVSVLSRRVLAPLLGIVDPRTDPRIDFVGGSRGLAELQRRVDGGEYAVAFAMFPTALAELMAVADAGDVMPPKSTWFEPKLADGLLSLPVT
ncbi:DUF1015 domain-containing protein [Defluviicoccus vanus]|uniref:DUF1015 domain-containing protein n=1 Tax=Defluviicoccus vanus TaxID=111831 RepID=A0A7H1N4S5_9PROT|nr:DUF1015 family protein [Defluviicoccus vanus]QNT70711.1 DUF1015 domain-containing protein [Defluviicoccus vanus]